MTLDISQGSVATYLWCGGIFNKSIRPITNFLVTDSEIILKISFIFGKVQAYKKWCHFGIVVINVYKRFYFSIKNAFLTFFLFFQRFLF